MGIEAPNKNRFWFPLDNAAKIFPSVMSDEIPAVFRIAAVLKEPIKIKVLQKALLLVEKRFPYYKVQLKEGFFWYYLEHLPKHIPVEVDQQNYCKKFSKGDVFVRALVLANQISLEFSHIVTDGGGSFEFFKTLLIEYSKILGTDVPEDFNYMKLDSSILEEEYEDAYNRFFKQEIPPMIRRSKSFHIPFALNPMPRFRLTTGIISIKQFKTVAKEKKVNITVYLIAVYLYILQEIWEQLPSTNKFKRNKTIRIQVPINLRNVFSTKTMRNFSLFVMPEIDLRLGHYTFDEILKTVFHQMQLETDEKLINKNISRNVGSEKKIYIRAIPLFIKRTVLRMTYYTLGTIQYSGVISNLGIIDLPPKTAEMIDYFYVIAPPPNKMLKINCGLVSFGDKLAFSFGNVTKSKEFEEKFIDFLKSQGIDMEILNSEL